jgi:hypothetical protein
VEGFFRLDNLDDSLSQALLDVGESGVADNLRKETKGIR